MRRTSWITHHQKRLTIFAIGALSVILFVGLQFSHSFIPALIHKFAKGYDLADKMQLCVPEVVKDDVISADVLSRCVWSAAKLPTADEPLKHPHFSNWLIYKTHFKTPEACLGKGAVCDLFLAEASNWVEVKLNGISIGKHGNFGPSKGYTNIVPAIMQLSNDLLQSQQAKDANELVIEIYTKRKSFTGLSKVPISILPADIALILQGAFIAETTWLPLFSGFGLLCLALIVTLSSSFNATHQVKINVYLRYCLVSAVLLFSLSRIPRAIFSSPIILSLHWCLRFLMDIAFFDLIFVSSDIRWGRIAWYRKVPIFIEVVFLGFGSVQLLTDYFGGAYFTTYYLVSTSLLLVLPIPVIGFIMYWGSFKKESRNLMLTTLGLVSLMSLWDVMAYAGFVPEFYYGRTYPLLIGIAFGYTIWMDIEKRQRELQVGASVGQLAAQVAHDIRSPISVLKILQKNSKIFSSEESDMLTHAVKRVEEVASNLLKTYRGNKAGTITGSGSKNNGVAVCNLANIILGVVTEQTIIRKEQGVRPPHFEINSDNRQLSALIQEGEFKRMLSNLLNNSYEALPMGRAAEIKIKLEKAGDRSMISISDNGDGVSTLKIEALNKGEFGTSSKAEGSGLGLSHTAETVTLLGGELKFEIGSNGGLVVRVVL